MAFLSKIAPTLTHGMNAFCKPAPIVKGNDLSRKFVFNTTQKRAFNLPPPNETPPAPIDAQPYESCHNKRLLFLAYLVGTLGSLSLGFFGGKYAEGRRNDDIEALLGRIEDNRARLQKKLDDAIEWGNVDNLQRLQRGGFFKTDDYIDKIFLAYFKHKNAKVLNVYKEHLNKVIHDPRSLYGRGLSQSGQGYTLLGMAARDGNAKAVKDILEASQNALNPLDLHAGAVYVQTASALFNTPGKRKAIPPISLAAREGHLRIVELLDKKQAQLKRDLHEFERWADSKGQDVIQHALKADQVKVLLYYQSAYPYEMAKPETINRYLDFALKANATRSIGWLLEISEPSVANLSQRLLRVAVETDDLAFLHVAFNRGAKAYLNVPFTHERKFQRDLRGQSYPLEWAVDCNNDKMACALVAAGAKCNIALKNSQTLVQMAVRNNADSLLELLFKNGARVHLETKDRFHNTPLFNAVARGKSNKMVQTLIEQGANIYTTNDQDQTLIHAAAVNRSLNEATILNLVKRVSKQWINKADKSGNTALFYAIMADQEDVVRTLLNYGADVANITKQNETAASIAFKHANETYANRNRYGFWVVPDSKLDAIRNIVRMIRDWPARRT